LRGVGWNIRLNHQHQCLRDNWQYEHLQF
jgi:hypothetical protein